MEGQNNERKFSNMKNRNTQLTAILFVLAFALAGIVQATPSPDGGPIRPPANEAPYPDGGPDPQQRLSLSIAPTMSPGGRSIIRPEHDPCTHALNVRQFLRERHRYAGVDYVVLDSPAYIGQSGYGVIQVQTLADPRGSSIRQAYSVVITLKDGAGYQ